MAKILIVEDEKPIADLIAMNLEMAGFETEHAADGEKAFKLIAANKYDLVLLDIVLPKMTGVELFPKIVGQKIPVIFLTSKDAVRDKVHGLTLGAEDYITKPFDNAELVARIKVVLRRQKKQTPSIKIGDITVDMEKRVVKKVSQEISLTMKEFELLHYLILHRGSIVSRDQLLENVWGYNFTGNTRTIDIHVKKLREKLGTEKIKTVFKMGYKLEE
ncbi:MAG: response regulator transcription factor [Spirochaetales bacterium]|nr:response regulator transcription factor [Spirochaetales bacterium]